MDDYYSSDQMLSFILSLVPLMLFVFFVWYFARLLKLNKDPEKKKGLTLSLVATCTLTVLMFIFRFAAFGAGEPVELPEPSEDGIQVLMKDTPQEDLQAAAKSDEEKVPEVLKQVQANAQEDEDEKFKRALNNALN